MATDVQKKSRKSVFIQIVMVVRCSDVPTFHVSQHHFPKPLSINQTSPTLGLSTCQTVLQSNSSDILILVMLFAKKNINHYGYRRTFPVKFAHATYMSLFWYISKDEIIKSKVKEKLSKHSSADVKFSKTSHEVPRKVS